MALDRDSIFEAEDPFALTAAWLSEAEAQEPNDPNAAALATVDPDGLPNVRVVLLKGFEPDAFVFYTNYESDKAKELDSAKCAAFVLHWKSLRRQIRARGPVTREDGAVADAYYQSRPIGSRLGAWASVQSRPLDKRSTLVSEVEVMRKRFGDTPPRPPFWGGYRIKPSVFEFWADGKDRLHDRFRWEKGPDGWKVTRLFP